MIKLSKHVTMIYIDHETNFAIIVEIKTNITNIDKFNLKLIKASIYFSQFHIAIRHRFDKFNIISNALNKLSMKFSIKNKISSLNIDAKKSKINQIYAYAICYRQRGTLKALPLGSKIRISIHSIMSTRRKKKYAYQSLRRTYKRKFASMYK